MKRAWALLWHTKADRMRADWSGYVAQWEADTEPGYPMSPWHEAQRRWSLAWADLFDAIGGQR